MLQSIDCEYPDERQLEEINAIPCMNCNRFYDPIDKAIFVETSNKLLWWHKEIGCKSFDKKYKNGRVYK